MTALRWTRRAIDAVLLVASAAVAVTAGLALLAPVVGGQTLVIGGGSMEPAISRGALVLAVPAAAADLAVGDVVTVRQGAATPYTHRVSRLAELEGRPYIETKGDANPAPDPAIVPVDAVIGKVAIAVPLLGFLSLLLGTPLGLLGFVAIATGLFAATWLLEDSEPMACAGCEACRDALSGEATTWAGAAGVAAVAAAPAAAQAAGVTTPAETTLGAPAGLAHPAGFTRTVATTRVRERGVARPTETPVLTEADRRNPRLRRRSLAASPLAVPVAPTAASIPATPTGAPTSTQPAVRHASTVRPVTPGPLPEAVAA